MARAKKSPPEPEAAVEPAESPPEPEAATDTSDGAEDQGDTSETLPEDTAAEPVRAERRLIT